MNVLESSGNSYELARFDGDKNIETKFANIRRITCIINTELRFQNPT